MQIKEDTLSKDILAAIVVGVSPPSFDTLTATAKPGADLNKVPNLLLTWELLDASGSVFHNKSGHNPYTGPERILDIAPATTPSTTTNQAKVVVSVHSHVHVTATNSW